MVHDLNDVQSLYSKSTQFLVALTCSLLVMSEANADSLLTDVTPQEQTTAISSIGIQLEYTASNLIQDWLTKTPVGTSQFPTTTVTPSTWTPWLIYNQQNWKHKLMFQATSLNHYNRTASSMAKTNLTMSILGIESERLIQTSTAKPSEGKQHLEKPSAIYWRVGVGLQFFLPYIHQTDSLYTTAEQESITQNSKNIQGQLAQVQLHVPLSLYVPIHQHIHIGLGLRTHLGIQRQETDYTVQWIQHISNNPMLCIQLN